MLVLCLRQFSLKEREDDRNDSTETAKRPQAAHPKVPMAKSQQPNGEVGRRLYSSICVDVHVEEESFQVTSPVLFDGLRRTSSEYR